MEDTHAGHFYFASESVGEGHPDKLCDQISDGILDACLQRDPNAYIAVETATKTKLVGAISHVDKIVTQVYRYASLERPHTKDPPSLTSKLLEKFAKT